MSRTSPLSKMANDAEKPPAANPISLDLASDAVQSATAAAFDPKLCRKLDRQILTPMFFLNFLSLMGRTNIGAALIQGLPEDLGMGPRQTFLAIVIPVVMLVLFEVPSNLLMRWLERRLRLPYLRYLGLVTVGLGRFLPAILFLFLCPLRPPFPVGNIY